MAVISGFLDHAADARNVDNPVAHHAAIEAEVLGVDEPVVDVKGADAFSRARDLSFDVGVPPHHIGVDRDAEDVFGATCLTPRTGTTIRDLAALAPSTLAVMHGTCFSGDGAGALLALADDYDTRLGAAMA